MKSKFTALSRIIFIAVLLFSVVGIIPVDVQETKAAITVTPLGAAASDKSGTNIDIVLGTISGNQTLILCFSGDGVSNVPIWCYTGSSSPFQTFVADAYASNSGNAYSRIYRISNNQAGTDASAYVRVALYPAGSAFGVSLYQVNGLDLSDPLDQTNSNTGTGTDASTNSSGLLSQDDEVVFACSAVEDEIDDGHGTWTTGTGYVSGNEQFDATNGGGDASNMQVHSVAKIVTDGTSQAYEGVDAGHDSTDWAACIASYKMESATPSLTNTPSPSSKDFGTVSEQTTYYCKGTAPNNPVVDGDCTWTITNDGSIAIDVNIKGTNFTGGAGWTLTSGTPGSNEAKITAYYSGQNPASGTVLTTSDQLFYNSLAASGTVKWDFSLLTGTFTDNITKSMTITLTAVTDS